MDQIQQDEDLKIALAFSGGGYRAACFALGTLAYLDKLKVSSGKSLLEHVNVLSTVSGGTITGAAYAIGIKQGKSFGEIYHDLYKFLNETDIVSEAIDRLVSEEGWNESRIKSLINAFSDVYDKALFDKARFGELMQEEPAIHLKHISFNATEFSTANQFRFQWSEKILNPKPGEPPRGIIGNGNFRIPEDVARDIRMADVLAASSCFPGGFEPINFPTDFIHGETSLLNAIGGDAEYPVGLMDGGIVDNQGIEPILLAEARMERNRTGNENSSNQLDLIILTDVASPYMEGYKASIENPARGWRNLTPAAILLLNSLLLLLSAFGLYWAFKNDNKWLMILSTAVTTISLVLFIIGRFLKWLPLKFNVPDSFLTPLGKLLKLKLQVYETIVVNRKNSILKMVGEVSLKKFRGLHYKQIYNDDSWKNRRIMNAIYELRTGESTLFEKIAKGELPEELRPTLKLQQVATLAASMGTTLWFTEDEIKKLNMINTIIACGEFTTCWNLLEYIIKAKRDPANLNSKHELILSLEKELMEDWKKFNEDPYWRVG